MLEVKERIHVLTIGDSRSADGIEKFHSGADLDELVATYDPGLHEAPVILGHSSDEDWSKLLSRNDSFPAYGWIKRVYREGNDLYVDLYASPELIRFIDEEKYKKRSLGYYGRDSKNNPSPGKLYIRHLAMLGASPPAIKGLEDIRLSETNKMAVDVETKGLLDKNSEEWLAFILKDEGNIIRDTIIAFDPKPSAENNYLYDSEERKWEGAFINETEDRFLFEILQQDNNGEPEFIVTVKADISENEAEEEEAVNEQDEQVADSAKTPDTPAEEQAKDNLSDQEVVEDTDKINLTEEAKMGTTLLKEKTTTEKEYANNGGDKPVEGEEMEYRDDGAVDKDEKSHGTPDPDNTDAVEDTEKRKHAYAKYREYMEAVGKDPMDEAKFMEMEYGSGAPVQEEEIMGEGCLGEDCPGEEQNEQGEYADTEKPNGEEDMTDLKAKYDAAEEELNMLRAKVKKDEEEKMKAREEEMVKFAEEAYSGNKILESQFPKADLEALLKGLLHAPSEHMVYGEGDNQKNALDVVQDLITKLPEQVTFAESETLIKRQSNLNGTRHNHRYSEGSERRRQQIIAIMRERQIPENNMQEYMAINNELTRTNGHYEDVK